MTSSSKSYEKERRSTRVRAQIPVRISSLEAAPHFSEHCHTVVINTDGCGIRLTRALEPGFRVALDELPGGNAASGTVSSCVAIGGDGKLFLVGLALDEPGNIWCIHPAPADWHSAPSTGTVVPPPEKANEWPYSVFSAKGEAHPGRK
jgi:hypothetical protein